MPDYKLTLSLNKLRSLIILSFQYYRLLLLYNLAFTSAVIFILTFPEFNISAEIFVFAKIIAFPSAVALYYYMAKDSYLYFKNAGFSMLCMYLNAFVIDVLICSLLIIINKCLH